MAWEARCREQREGEKVGVAPDRGPCIVQELTEDKFRRLAGGNFVNMPAASPATSAGD
ncbi:MAG: hypothetical protein N2512_06525 [Armatimonadetes bacterium]|nr:hypothetical protein [Armatimonadota bacterium]